MVNDISVTRQMRFRRLAWLGLFWLTTLHIGADCLVDRSGLFPSIAGWGGTFDVRPMYICRGESIEASWELHPRDASGAALGLEIFLAWSLLTGDIVAAGTPEVPVVGGIIRTPDPNMGSRTLFPMADTAYFFDATIEGLSPLTRERRDVRVVEMEIGGVRIRPELFQFRCSTGESGGPGWTTLLYERGQLASASIRITQVRNMSLVETIRLLLKRNRDEEMLPPTTAEATIAPRDTSVEFNGEYYGLWTATPLSRGSDEAARLICDTPVTVSVLGIPPAAPGTLAEDRLEDIRIEVTFECVTPPDAPGDGKG